MKRIITMIPAALKPLDRFVALGPLPMCERCWLKDKCALLKRGWIYEVKNIVGQVKHKCPIHGEVIAAEVEELGIPLIVPKKVAIPGATVTYFPISCERKECPYWNDCVGKYRSSRGKMKVRIVEILEDVKCPKGETLVKVIGVPEIETRGRKKWKTGRRG